MQSMKRTDFINFEILMLAFIVVKPFQISSVFRLYHPGSGRCLNMYSTEPGVQVYSGGHMPDITGKGGNKYRKFASLCLESQHYPDSPHHMDDVSLFMIS